MTNTNVFPSLAHLDKYFVGFDTLSKRIHEATDTFAKAIPNYPPYNLVKVDENKYVIELAVAGFGKHNLDVEIQDGTLKVHGYTTVDDMAKEGLDIQYLYKGIADRAFTRKFTLADTIEIKNAELINGMLKIWLENVIPDHKKPKKVDIVDKNEEAPSTKKELLTEKSL